jgi:dihydroorotate dehydrogenase (NAD+) catalytic subunit
MNSKNRYRKMEKPDLRVNLAGIRMRNPVMVASGTFGYGEEYASLIDVKKLGAIVLKSVTLKPREGNVPPRLVETPAGLLNAIGIHNIGVEALKAEKLPGLRNAGTPVIVNIWGENVDEFVKVTEALGDEDGIAGIELNLSCPNVGGRLFAQDAAAAGRLLENVRKRCHFPLIAKLSPQVTDISEIAKACEDSGADAVSLINSFPAMAIDVETKRPLLGSVTGGLSGSAIRPIAVKMVWEVSKAVKVPVVGMGGIMSASDAIEFMLAGAKAVAVGTANFVNPRTAEEIVEGIETYLAENGFSSVSQIVGVLDAR